MEDKERDVPPMPRPRAGTITGLRKILSERIDEVDCTFTDEELKRIEAVKKKRGNKRKYTRDVG